MKDRGRWKNKEKLEICQISQVFQGIFSDLFARTPTGIFLTYHSLTPVSEISEKRE